MKGTVGEKEEEEIGREMKGEEEVKKEDGKRKEEDRKKRKRGVRGRRFYVTV